MFDCAGVVEHVDGQIDLGRVGVWHVTQREPAGRPIRDAGDRQYRGRVPLIEKKVTARAGAAGVLVGAALTLGLVGWVTHSDPAPAGKTISVDVTTTTAVLATTPVTTAAPTAATAAPTPAAPIDQRVTNLEGRVNTLEQTTTTEPSTTPVTHPPETTTTTEQQTCPDGSPISGDGCR